MLQQTLPLLSCACVTFLFHAPCKLYVVEGVFLEEPNIEIHCGQHAVSLQRLVPIDFHMQTRETGPCSNPGLRVPHSLNCLLRQTSLASAFLMSNTAALVGLFYEADCRVVNMHHSICSHECPLNSKMAAQVQL